MSPAVSWNPLRPSPQLRRAIRQLPGHIRVLRMLAPAFAVTGLLLLGLAGPMDQPPIAAIGRTLVLGSIAMLFLYRVRRQMSLKDVMTSSGGTSLAPRGGKSSMNAVANSIALNGLGLGITGLAALVSALIAAVSLL